MKNPPTLIDAMLGELYRPAYKDLDPKNWLRTHLMAARRFVLDDNMSAFMADLAYASLSQKICNPRRDIATLEGMRSLARLPHKVTWVEFNLRARFNRAVEAYGVRANLDVPAKGGWLFVQHPQIDTAFQAVECLSHTTVEKMGNPDLGAPLSDVPSAHFINWVWRTDDDPLPWFSVAKSLTGSPQFEDLLTGIPGYVSKQVGVIEAPYIAKKYFPSQNMGNYISKWMNASASDLRYAWALLAAINDIPMTVEQVRPNKGYVARGQYRKFVEHTVIKLKIPGRTSLRTLAGRVSRAARRRAHMVRGHWRNDYRHPGGPQLWIAEHQRGDASLGFVTHDYNVTRGEW